MKIEVILPDLGEDGVQAVKVSAWLAEKGAKLREGDDLLEITTDKAAFCVPAPRAGTLTDLKVSPGDTIRVGQVICTFETV
ncbi:MAG: biotin/lipoyl-containing protein [Candidatus Hydrogenedentota bacterium]